MIPPIPHSLVGGWPDKTLFGRDALTKPLRLSLDLDTIRPGQALRLLRLLPTQVKAVEILTTGQNPSWPVDGWPLCSTITVRFPEPPDAPYAVYGPAGEDRGRGMCVIWEAQRCDRVARSRAGDEPTRESIRRSLLNVAAGASVADLAATGYDIALADQSLRDRGVMSVEESLAVLGLWLRRRARPVFERSVGLVRPTSPWMFYWIATRAALPAGWNYVSACYDASRTRELPRLGDLAISSVVRLSRALRARDELHALLWEEGSRDMAELLYHLDVFLVMLLAAYDATERTAYAVYHPEGPPLKKSWRHLKPGELAPEAAEFSDARSGRVDALQALVGVLRNSIHEEPLNGASGGTLSSATIDVPRHLADDLVRHASTAGSLVEFGIEESDIGLRIRPALFVERVVVRVLADVNVLMEATDVTRLGVTGADMPHRDDETFGELATGSALLLAGLDEFLNPMGGDLAWP